LFLRIVKAIPPIAPKNAIIGGILFGIHTANTVEPPYYDGSTGREAAGGADGGGDLTESNKSYR